MVYQKPPPNSAAALSQTRSYWVVRGIWNPLWRSAASAWRPFERLCFLLIVPLDGVLGRRLEILDGIVDAAPERLAMKI